MHAIDKEIAFRSPFCVVYSSIHTLCQGKQKKCVLCRLAELLLHLCSFADAFNVAMCSRGSVGLGSISYQHETECSRACVACTQMDGLIGQHSSLPNQPMVLPLVVVYCTLYMWFIITCDSPGISTVVYLLSLFFFKG